jgi:hypothetical protein
MTKTIQTILAAAIVLGSASIVRADDGTDFGADTSKSGAAVTQGLQFKSSKVALPMNQVIYLDQAGASHDNGGN